MKVGIVGGTGPAGQALAARVSASGAEVVVGSREAARGEEIASALVEKWRDRNLLLRGGSNDDAASSDIVVLATPWDGAVNTALGLSQALKGRVLVSMVNALARVGNEFQALVPARGSIAASVQAVVRDARVTAAFQHLPAGELADLDKELHSDVIICGDDKVAREETAELVELVPGLRAVHGGSLASANAVEALTAVLLNVNITYKTHVSIELRGLLDTEVVH